MEMVSGRQRGDCIADTGKLRKMERKAQRLESRHEHWEDQASGAELLHLASVKGSCKQYSLSAHGMSNKIVDAHALQKREC